MESDLSTCTMGTDLRGSVVEKRSVCGYYARRICGTGRSRLTWRVFLPRVRSLPNIVIRSTSGRNSWVSEAQISSSLSDRSIQLRAGSLNPTLNEQAGAKTPLSLIFASITLAFCLLFLTGFLQNLPKAVLAAIVLMAVKGLIKFREIGHLWRVSRLEFTVAAVALVGVLLFGILNGVFVSAVASILLLPHHAARPHVAFLGRIPGTRRISDLARHRDNERIPGVLPFRVESAILYFNVDHILRIVLDRVEAEAKSLRLIVCDLSTSPTVDLAGARTFLDLYTELAKRGMTLRLVEAHASIRDLLRIEGAEDRISSLRVWKGLFLKAIQQTLNIRFSYWLLRLAIH